MGGKEISIGKRRGLASTSDENGIFNILAFDHRQSFVDMVTSETAPDVVYRAAAAAKLEVIKNLCSAASAVLLDPLFGAPQAIAVDALPRETGLLVAVEKSGYTGDSTARETKLLPGWGVKKIKRMAGDAVKLLIYYHPESGRLAEDQEQLVREVASACQQEDIAFFLEAVTYSMEPGIDKKSAEFAAGKPEVVTKTVRRLSALDPDVLKIEFPVDAHWNPETSEWVEACQMVAEASACPWTVLSAGVDFDVFRKQVEIACQAGASGFIGGRAIWKEGIGMAPEKREEWLRTTARERLLALSKTASEHGTPWTDFYPPQDFAAYQNWYKNY